MTTYKAKLAPADLKRQGEQIAERLAAGGKLLTQVTHTSASNLSYRYTVRLAYIQNGRVEIQNLAYFIGAATGQSIVSKYYGDELRGNGLGTDRHFLASLELGHILKNLGLISSEYEIATRAVYSEI